MSESGGELTLSRELERGGSDSRTGDEVVGFLYRVTESAASNHAVKAAAASLGVEGHGDRSDEARAGAALGELLRLGQADGDIRPGVAVDDIYLLMATAPTAQPADIRRRWTTLILPGITTTSAGPLCSIDRAEGRGVCACEWGEP